MKSAVEFSEIVGKWLKNAKHLKPLSNDEIKNITAIEMIIACRITEIRDELIAIRTLADENPMKSKQKLTNLIKELK